VELIEHIREEELPRLCQQVFSKIGSKYVLVTTPNQEFNVHFGMKAGEVRHPGHIFEWTREQFRSFCAKVESEYKYGFEVFGVGEHLTSDKEGCCSQGAFFTKCENAPNPAPPPQPNNPPEAFYRVVYPFWQNRLQFAIECELRNQVLRNNYEQP
jgi:hypothetical protein